MDTRSLDKIFAPRSIAVVGASDKPGKVGTVTLANLQQAGFAGPIYPVNPHHDELQGLRCYPGVGELPRGVDLAILCTPAEGVPALIRQCGDSGIGGVVVLTAGFREIGATGRALDAALRDELRRFPQMRIVGPNCLGVIVPKSKLNASFAASMPLAGRVAFISQSGALCTAMLDWACDDAIGFSYFVSVGNMLDVSLGDLIDYFGSADGARMPIILYIESISEAREFHVGGPGASPARKPIVAYKAGRFAESAQAAASHTGAMAGVDGVYEAAFQRAGIERIFEIDDMFDCAELLARPQPPKGDRLAIVTNAGGPGVMTTDALIARERRVGRSFPTRRCAQLNELLPTCWSHGNPIDVLGDAPPDRFAKALEIVSADSEVDAVLVILTPQAMTDPTATAEAVADVAQPAHKPVLAAWMGSHMVRRRHRNPQQGRHAHLHHAERRGAGVHAPGALRAEPGFLHETPREVPLHFERRPRQLARALRHDCSSRAATCCTRPRPSRC